MAELIKCNIYRENAKFEVERIAKQNDEKRDKYTVKGYPLLFNIPSKTYNEKGNEITMTISPNALDETNLNGRIYLLCDHDWSKRLGRNGKNLEFQVDKNIGLFMKCELPNTQYARDIFNEVEDEILDSMSFSALAEYETDNKGNITYTKIVEFYEASLVANPQFLQASVIVANNENSQVKVKEEIKPEEIKAENQFIEESEFKEILKEFEEV